MPAWLSPYLLFPCVGAVLLAALPALHWGLRRALRAPRLREADDLAAHGVAGQTVRIPTVRQRHLFGWWLPAPADAGVPASVAIILHGWGGNAEVMLPLARPLLAAGHAVLLIDARSHGRSDDDDFSSLPRFAEDLDAALDWVRARADVDGDRIAAIGHSVGAGAALLCAARGAPLAAVVSLAAFTHPAEIMRRWLASRRVPYWPLGWYVLRYVQRVIGFRFDAIAPINTIARVRCPILLMHGADDATVPASDAQRLYDRRSHAHVRLCIEPGAHDSMQDLLPHAGVITGFLAAALARPA